MMYAGNYIAGKIAVHKLLLLGIAGLSRTSGAHTAIIIGLTQVLILACWRGRERMTAQTALGMLMALAGVAFSCLQPVFATAMGVALLGEQAGRSVIAGGAVILSGEYLAGRV